MCIAYAYTFSPECFLCARVTYSKRLPRGCKRHTESLLSRGDFDFIIEKASLAPG